MAEELSIDITYTLSPSGQGKIERPCRWIQDRLVRTCAREDATDILSAHRILKKEIYRYNFKQVYPLPQEKSPTSGSGKSVMMVRPHIGNLWSSPSSQAHKRYILPKAWKDRECLQKDFHQYSGA